MEKRWRIELTHGAEASLRALERTQRRVVVSRIDGLESEGVRSGLRHEVGSRETFVVMAGEQALFCMERTSERRIVIIAVRSLEDGDARGLVAVAGRSLDRLRRRRWGAVVDTVIQDIRFAVRSLRRSSGFAIGAVLTLGLGIGAAAAIFSVADGVLLRPLPWKDPDAVVTLWTSWDNFPDKTWVSVPEYQLFHQENRTLEDLALYATGSSTFTSADNPERVGAAAVTPNTFEVLGVRPVVGRTFTWEEAKQQNAGVLLSWDVWQRRYAGDPGVTQRTVELDGSPFPVLGVLPQGFALPTDYGASSVSEVFYPFYVDLESPAPDLGSGGSHGWYGVGRLRPGVTVEQAQADFDRIMTGVSPVGMYSPEHRFRPKVFDAKTDILGSSRSMILLLLGAVAFVLLIACGNVANLLLSRSETRRGEVAVRAALGAGRGRIVRQLLTENVVLAITAGVVGYVLAVGGVRLLLSIDPNAVPRSGSISLDAPVLLFTLALSLATVLLFGAMPAFRTSSRGLASKLHEGGRSGRISGSSRLQGLLVASQMAMAVILLTGSALLIRTFIGLMHIDPGFHAENVLTLRISAPAATYPDGGAVDRFYSGLLRRIREIPGVRSAGAARLLPLASTMGDSGFRPVGYVAGPDDETQADWQWVTPGYIETMGIPLLEGRTFDDRDVRGAPAVVMINEVVARRYWGNESPIGQRVRAFGAPDTIARVIGVVGNVSHNGITAEVKTRYYVPLAQVHDNATGSARSMTLTIATNGPPLRYLEPVRREIRASDPTVAISEIKTLDDVLSASVAQPRFAMVLLAIFAAVALALALVGIYGVLAYGVSKRTREIGVRMALGARTNQVVGLVIRQGMLMAVIGVVAGTSLSFGLSGLLSGLLYNVSPQDPVTFAGVATLFILVALIACWIPAARAARIRPVHALRTE